MTGADLARALVGGGLLGAAGGLLLLAHGQVAGVSGILRGLAERGAGWRWAFVAGLVTAGCVATAVAPDTVASDGQGLGWSAAAGLLIGTGARLGDGCTSGHGVCGLSRGSARSLVSVAVFMATGVVTATVVGAWSR